MGIAVHGKVVTHSGVATNSTRTTKVYDNFTTIHTTLLKLTLVNKLQTISRKLGVFLDEENMLRYRLRGESISVTGKNFPKK